MSKDRAAGLSLPLHAQQPTDLSATDTLIDINYIAPTPAAPTFETGDPTTTIPPSYFDSQPSSHKSRSHPHAQPSSSSSARSSPTETLHAHGYANTARAERRSSTLPATHRYRTIVLCFDGTGNKFTAENTNVVRFISLLKRDDKDQQVVYYQPGIGTYSSERNRILSKADKTIDFMIAWHLDNHVMAGYKFLMQSYKSGDRICLIGFSRGAYVARSLAGMLHKVGLLPANNWEQVPFAYRLYKRTTENAWKASLEFKKTFAANVQIEFVGVWDTVSSVGLIPRRLPFTTSNTIIKTFRHALSLDERRAKFQPNFFHRPNEEDLKRNERHAAEVSHGERGDHRYPYVPGIDSASATYANGKGRRANSASESLAFSSISHSQSAPADIDSTPLSLANSQTSLLGKSKHRHSHSGPSPVEEEQELSEDESHYSESDGEQAVKTDVKEVWFVGCHGDVGGGCVKNDEPHSLAHLSLRWMIQECFRTNSGILFDVRRLHEVGMKGDLAHWQRPPNLVEVKWNEERTAEGELRALQAEDEHNKSFFKRLFGGGSKSPSTGLQASNSSSANHDSNVGPTASDTTTTTTVGAVITEAIGNTFHNDIRLQTHDTHSPLHDMLAPKGQWWWWILEYIPMEYRWQDKNDLWVKEVRMNRGRGRRLTYQKQVFVHESVKLRIDQTKHHDEDERRYRPAVTDLFQRDIIWTD